MVDAKSKREATKLLDLFSAEVQKGEYIEPSKLTFSRFVERWLRDYAETNLAPKTLFRYKDILITRILPAMGHLKLEQIKPFHLMEFYKNLQEDGIRKDGKKGGLSAKTILQHHRVISSIFSCAVEWQVVSSNPASRVKPPKVQKKQINCYDEGQTALLLQLLEEEELKYRALVHLALFTGLRRGELMGLEWPDIDFNKNTLMVRQASQYLPGEGIFQKAPKNETSVRLLSLPKFLIDILRQLKKEQAAYRLEKVGDAWQKDSNWIFTTWNGGPMHPDTVTSWFPKFVRICNLKETFNAEIKRCEKKLSTEELVTLIDLKEQYLKLSNDKSAASKKKLATLENSLATLIGKDGLERIKQNQILPPLSFHGLRHTAATMLINQGLPAKSVSGRLGHANIGTTYDIYGHYLKSADKEASDRLEQVYKNMKGNGIKDVKKEQA
ncbi:tyrosine-type recombinase/integrase [Pelotomaculum sp. FP]|uniref:tyrosine-type recombinase/integrase n=1 Tax=Pelotomaculum sp. FP TaxID=261474 RepID=UPI001FA9D9C1|nr:tyrosine-type recombinase/integrase [Pelotomaculum sp. FP]